MTTVNILGLSLAGQTGTGLFAGSIAPTFNVLTCNNINISGNTISSIDTNGNINLIANGSGVTQGLVFIGGPVSSGGFQKLQIVDITNGAGAASTTYSASGFNVGSVWYLNRSRSIVPGAHTAVGSGDLLGQITFNGDDGGAYMAGANIYSAVTAAVSSGIVPSALKLQTANTSGTLTDAISISNAQIVTLTNPLPSTSGGTGVSNTGTWTNGGNVTFSGAHTFTGTLTGDTTVTFPTSGTLATTSSASGVINSGAINDLAYYAAAGTTLSGLATANNGVLITSAGGVPSISSTLPAAVQGNITALGTLSTPLAPGSGGTGVANTGTWTNGGNVTFSGAHTFTGTLTADTAVTFPTSGTLAITSSASGIINAGTTNELAYYAGNGSTLSGLATANSGTLITSAGGVPSISSTLPSAVQNNITLFGIINTDLGFTSAATRYVYINDPAFTGELEIQAGDGSAAHGADLRLYGPSHATNAGWAQIGLSAVGGAKFQIKGAGLGTGSTLLTVDNSGNLSALASLSGTTLISSPAVSQGSGLSTGSAYQNPFGYDVVLTVYLAVTAATSGTIQVGVGPTNTPTQQTVVSALTLASLAIIPLTIYLPASYYALVTLTTVTATISGQQAMPV